MPLLWGWRLQVVTISARNLRLRPHVQDVAIRLAHRLRLIAIPADPQRIAYLNILSGRDHQRCAAVSNLFNLVLLISVITRSPMRNAWRNEPAWIACGLRRV